MRANIAAIADAIRMAKKKADANVATITNVIVSNAKASAKIAVNANASKMASNIKPEVYVNVPSNTDTNVIGIAHVNAD